MDSIPKSLADLNPPRASRPVSPRELPNLYEMILQVLNASKLVGRNPIYELIPPPIWEVSMHTNPRLSCRELRAFSHPIQYSREAVEASASSQSGVFQQGTL